MSDNAKQFPLETWGKGEPITHAKLNQVVEAVRYVQRGIRPARQVAPSYANADIIRQMQILSISGDTLSCALNDGSTGNDVLYTVARPVLLRRSLTSWNSIAYTYSDDQTRVATPGGSQTVTPAYVIGDIIYAAQSVDGGPTVLDASGIPVDWFDINADGRTWLNTTAQYSIVTVQGDYLTCHDGATPANTVYIAKPTRLRTTDTVARAVANQTYTVTKSAFSSDGQSCTATRSSDSATENLGVDDLYVAGDKIVALPCSDTGLTDPNGKKIVLIDANVDARHWAAKATT